MMGNVSARLVPLVGLLALIRPAAADEKEWQLALVPAASLIRVGDRTAWGGGGGVDLAYGVTDSFALRVTGAFTGHALSAETENGTTSPGGSVLACFGGVGVTW